MKRKLYSLSIAICIISANSMVLRAQESPLQGDIIITEFMANPSAVSDTKGEWFELLNISSKNLKLNGLIIKDESSNSHEIEGDQDILLAAGEYFVLARSAVYEENGGITPDYSYSNFALGNTEDEIILCLPDGSVLDQLYYSGDWDIISGASLELDPLQMDKAFNQDPGTWKPAINVYGMGDLGSPGYENSSSTGLSKSCLVENLDLYPNPCYEEFNLDLELKEKVPLKISLVNIAGQEMVIYSSNYCNELSLQFDSGGLEKGVWLLRLIMADLVLVRKLLVY